MIDEVILKQLPANVRKVIVEAEDKGWELHGKGATFCLRLDHPTDELARPFYVTWQVGVTAKGAISYRFMSACTDTLQSLSAGDVLTYLADPTVIYPEDESEEAVPEGD